MTRQRTPSVVLETMQALWGLAHALEARSKWMHRRFGVTGPQRLLIRVIGDSPGCSPGEAARQLRLHKGTVTRLLGGLERLKLVERHADAIDGRRQRLALTARGRRVYALREGTVEAAVQGTLDSTSSRERRAALAFVSRLTSELTPTGDVPDA
ncbi:MAG TPA: MarR family winged helix-turn-helix transcriptional regulator [Anaeromyxobacteraceae bacterium]|nr:MarR family winged helix-turn-helix transcriptional regulator [Anaeromyxobacteraceae bacterium]